MFEPLKRNHVQDSLEIMLVSGQQVEVVAGKVALECTVGRTAGEKGLIQVWVVGVPVPPIFAEKGRDQRRREREERAAYTKWL